MKKPGELQLIQTYRALAVLLVVLSHGLHELKKMLAPMGFNLNDKLIPGDFGVDLFFVISGFIMVYATRNANGSAKSALQFVKRRIIRIVPLYWIVTTLMIGIVVVAPQVTATATALPENWLKSYLFIPFAREVDGLYRPVLGLGWSLNYEMFFYAAFALCMLLPREKALLSLMFGLCGFTIAVQTGLVDIDAFDYLGRPIMMEFGFGVAIGWLYLCGVRANLGLGLYGVVIGSVAVIAMPEYHISLEFCRHLFYGLPAAMLVAAAVLTRGWDEMRVPAFFQKLGDMSYSTYLVHPFVLGLATLAWKKADLSATLGNGWGLAAYLAFVVIASHIVALLVHEKLDRPLTNWLAKRKPMSLNRQVTMGQFGARFARI